MGWVACFNVKWVCVDVERCVDNEELSGLVENIVVQSPPVRLAVRVLRAFDDRRDCHVVKAARVVP